MFALAFCGAAKFGQLASEPPTRLTSEASGAPERECCRALIITLLLATRQSLGEGMAARMWDAWVRKRVC